ncbi:MAG: T9SS type A sorting domain-containing protein [Bacteroidota bacterium]
MLLALAYAAPLHAQISWTPMPSYLRAKVLSPSDWITQGGLGLSRTRDTGEHWETVLAQPLSLTATNRSSFTRTEAMLEWNDPGLGGQIAGYTLERAGADSMWMPVDIDVQPPDQFCYVAQPAAGRPVFRYRLTLQALSGEVFVAVSDTVSMLPGTYVDILDAILPDSTEDQQLVYEYFHSWRFYSGPLLIEGDTTYQLTLTFLPYEKVSRALTRFPMRLDGDGPSGEHWTSGPWIDSYSTKEPFFRYFDTTNSVGFSPLAWGGGTRWFYDDSGSVFISNNRLVPVQDAGIGGGDSLVFDMLYKLPIGGDIMFRYVCKPTDGIIRHGEGPISNSHFARMVLLRTVNGIQHHPPLGLTEIGVPYPNPVSATAVVPFVLPEAGRAVVTVHDLLGREVARLTEGHREAGRHSVTLDARRLSPGAYLLRLQAGGMTSTRIFIRP